MGFASSTSPGSGLQELIETPVEEAGASGSANGSLASRHGRPILLTFASQGIVAGSSLVLQWCALDQLGAPGLAKFAILNGGLLVTLTALHTGWVADPLVLLQRRVPSIRRALWISLWVWTTVAIIGGLVGGRVFASLSWFDAALFAVALGFWTVEESMRRLLMAQLRFGSLLLNDCSYAVGALGLTFGVIATGELTMRWLISALVAGSFCAVALGLKQLPREELVVGPPARADLRTLVQFSSWRSGQLGLRPLGGLLARLVLQTATSSSVLGLFEVGRLAVAPLLTAAIALSAYLLPNFVATQAGENLTHRRLLRAYTGGLVAGALFIPIPFVVARTVLAGGGRPEPSTALLAAWTAYAVFFVAMVPFTSLLTAAHRTREVFWGRLVETVCAVVFVAIAARGSLEGVPIALLLAGLVGNVWTVVTLWINGVLAVPARLAQIWAGDRSFVDLARSEGHSTIRPWLGITACALIVASDFEWRRRGLAGSLSGSADLAVLVELGVYFLLGLYLLLRHVSPPRALRPTAVQFFARSWVYFALASALWSTYPALGLVRAAQLCVVLVLAMTLGSAATARDMNLAAHGYLLLISGSVILGLYWREPYSRLQQNRFAWMAVHPVVAGSMLSIAVTVALGYLLLAGNPLSSQRVVRSVGEFAPRASWSIPAQSAELGERRRLFLPQWAYPAIFALCWAGLLATRTRGSIAAGVVGCAVVLAVGVSRRNLMPMLLLGSVGVVLGALLFLNPVLQFLSRGESTSSLKSLNSRLPLWTLAGQLFEERPLLGWGLASSRGLFFDKIGLGGAHNAYVNVAVDGGVVGLVLWGGLIVALLVALSALHQRRWAEAPLGIGVLLCMLTNGLTSEGLGSGAGVSTIWLFLIAAWVGVGQRENRGRRSQLGQALPTRVGVPTGLREPAHV